MRWLNRRPRRERGASAVLVAVALVPLIGAGAIAVDVGALFAERSQLQNGVDAAAMAVASACAKDKDMCEASARATAQQYVTGNEALTYDATADEPVIRFVDNEVTVTATADVDHYLAAVFAGSGAETVYASGSALWGSPVRGGVLPIGFGNCEFEAAEMSEPGDTANRVTIEYGVQDRRGCNVTDNPGGFGWLNDDSRNCEVEIDLEAVDPNDLWFGGASGSGSGSSGCGAVRDYLQPKVGTIMLIPIFDEYKSIAATATCAAATPAGGPKHCYHVSQFAAFYLTGGKLDSFNQPDPYATASDPPEGRATGYLQGNFVEYVAVDELEFELGDGGDEGGISVVQLIITDSELAALLD